jgi:hypothetical protein
MMAFRASSNRLPTGSRRPVAGLVGHLLEEPRSIFQCESFLPTRNRRKDRIRLSQYRGSDHSILLVEWHQDGFAMKRPGIYSRKVIPVPSDGAFREVPAVAANQTIPRVFEDMEPLCGSGLVGPDRERRQFVGHSGSGRSDREEASG